MYRLVMVWITDGSGGSGLNEEEFGGWAVKVNAGITFVEYTLTFLVSMAALVTFLADRFPVLNQPFLGVQYRTFVAIGLTTAIGLQICINMGVALGLLPTKGLTLPFLSYGGTSLLMNMMSIGVLMNIGAMKKVRKRVANGR